MIFSSSIGSGILIIRVFALVKSIGVAIICTSLLTAGASANQRSSKEENSDTFIAAGLPDGLSLVGLVGDEWLVLVSKSGKLHALTDIKHPRSHAYHHDTLRVAWIGPDNKLRERDLTSGETTLLGPVDSPVRYTQPSYSSRGKKLVAVELPDGRSRTTRIVSFNLPSGESHFLVRKRTAQFEPHVHEERLLHYTTAICVDDCVGMIWELWQRDLHTARQQQLTLLNAVSKTPRMGRDGWLYFSSDAGGMGFHLWRTRPEPGSTTEQLTFGEVRDSDPAPDGAGSVYFIRQSQRGAALMRLVPGSKPVEVDLDERITDLRNLELSP